MICYKQLIKWNQKVRTAQLMTLAINHQEETPMLPIKKLIILITMNKRVWENKDNTKKRMIWSITAMKVRTAQLMTLTIKELIILMMNKQRTQ